MHYYPDYVVRPSVCLFVCRLTQETNMKMEIDGINKEGPKKEIRKRMSKSVKNQQKQQIFK